MKLSELQKRIENIPCQNSFDDIDVVIQLYDPISGKPITCIDFSTVVSFGPNYRQIILLPKKAEASDE
jgi:hypothetical protein